MKLFSSFDAPLHVILRRFKIIPIVVLVFFMVLTWEMTEWYQGVALQLQDWQVAPIFGYLGVLIGAIKFGLDAVRKGEEIDHHDKQEDANK